jgi:hypothetical protein
MYIPAYTYIHMLLMSILFLTLIMNIATNIASLALGWPLGEYGKPRDTPLPWPPDLNALGSDADLTATMNKIMDDTLNLNSASDVTLYTCKC